MGKNSYGLTPWGRWFIEILDSYSMGERLDRGRRYANAGKVLSLEIVKGKVTAKVKGNYRPSYKVIINFPELKERGAVLELLKNDPALLAEIAAGRLPEAFLQKLKNKHIDLIPARWNEMKRSCTCPDYGDPCKHQAALYYIIAQEIDADPLLLFRLRGIDLSAAVRQFGGNLEHEIAPPFVITAAPQEKANSPQVESISIPEIPLCTELICSLLPAAPPFSERDFAVVMAEYYHQAARFVYWQGEESEEEEHRASRSRWIADSARGEPGAAVFLTQEDANGNRSSHSLFETFLRFRNFSSDDGTESYSFLFYLFKFLNLICRAGAFIPAVFLNKDSLAIIWTPFEKLPLIAQTLNLLAERGNNILMIKQTSGVRKTSGAGKTTKEKKEKPVFADGMGAVNLLSSAFLSEWVRQNDFRTSGGAAVRELSDLFFRGAKQSVLSPNMRSLPLAIDRWLSPLHTDFTAWKYRFTVKTAKHDDSSRLGGRKPAADSTNSGFSLSIELALPAADGSSAPTYVPLKDAAKATGGIEALKAPSALSNYLPEIQSLFSKKEIGLTETRLIDFLDSGAELLSRLGIEVTLPKSLHRELKPRLVLQAETSDSAKGKKGGNLVKYLELDSLLSWNWRVAIGDELLSPEEFAALLAGKNRLVKFREQYIRIDPDELARLLKKINEETRPGINDFLKSHFSGDSILSFDAKQIIDTVFKEKEFPVPADLTAALRPYQERGYAWLCSLIYAGFGCILADDMGLGKTVQAIAVLLRLEADGLLKGKALIVAPAALLENWERELSRFAPSLKTGRYHGAKRKLDDSNTVFLTTYQTASRDEEKLSARTFSILIADEAHIMKNAATRAAKTLRSLKTERRLALSGTPVENRLEDMRSLFDFALPGYLGNASQFREAYRVPIEVMRSRAKADNLKKITAPFLLRRLKTDKTIIADLPEKIIIDEYPGLEKDQAALYETVVSRSLERSEKTEDPAERSALVLNLLTSLKQICDHPRVYDKESPAAAKLSGKALLLLALLPDIIANREKVLVFSQYVETLNCLETILRAELGEAPLVYHGGMSQKRRSDTVDAFQNDPACRILLVSLKAGGLGLNLTAASRVIHYDLWYNPAVENQATDRAFRIGQQRNVFVHRFIVKNTFEEKIDAMIRDKRELAGLTVSSGESWLARMNHEELRELFRR